jgi:hypothetical protein
VQAPIPVRVLILVPTPILVRLLVLCLMPAPIPRTNPNFVAIQAPRLPVLQVVASKDDMSSSWLFTNRCHIWRIGFGTGFLHGVS